MPEQSSTASASALTSRGTPMVLWLIAAVLGAMLAVVMALAAWIWFG